MKARSFPDSTLNPEASTVGLHDMAGDGEAQAGATGFAGTCGIYPVEALENSRLLCLGDSNTRDDVVIPDLLASASQTEGSAQVPRSLTLKPSTPLGRRSPGAGLLFCWTSTYRNPCNTELTCLLQTGYFFRIALPRSICACAGRSAQLESSR